MQEAVNTLAEYLPSLLGAIILLVVGWFVAALAARGTRAALARTGASKRLATAISEEEGQVKQVEVWAGRAVFGLIALFVLVGFFQALGLSGITEPLSGFLNEIFTYAPRLIGPVILVVVAWALARVLKLLVQRGLSAIKADSYLASEAELGEEGGRSITDALGEATYWLTWVLFLPLILGALELGGLLDPVRGMIDRFLVYLPNVFAAGVILFVGWIVARILRRVATNVLVAVGADRLSSEVGADKALGAQGLSGLIGLVIYVLVLIPVIIAALNALELNAVTAPASEMLNDFLTALPNLFAAAVLLGIAYFVARFLAGVVQNLLEGIGFDTIPQRIGLQGETTGPTPSTVVGQIALVAIMLFALVESLRLIGFDAVAALVTTFLIFAGRIIVGLIVIALGLYLARIAAQAIAGLKMPRANLLAAAARASIVILAVAMGVGEMGLAAEIIFLAFGILFGAIALAVAIAFGLGAREQAGRLAERWVGELEDGGKKAKS